ncbi:hypothetical protein M758_1G166400 [Ceratodon purpureus]|uniref:Uncharacterized protein n=1 Tax=Ceratodon purpureus TaxID=3225 RepID=A0A8T0J604_CERPU|nr:hypothetical protein KC19_1G170100 [Ceratodon purpureus]KAG0630266.1 hypothetical protein M758_1G166400 [Ceratodon purpureus]
MQDRHLTALEQNLMRTMDDISGLNRLMCQAEKQHFHLLPYTLRTPDTISRNILKTILNDDNRSQNKSLKIGPARG